ncbi:MAG: imidazoleglycerol-phosphate dehydratase [Peltula sp. TS41687]|nr:MAG: imidazoleglycerol-phosphate dehydratase [Peltula sp. TS41687]
MVETNNDAASSTPPSASSSSSSSTARTASFNRSTNETSIQISLSIDGGPLPQPTTTNDDQPVTSSSSSTSKHASQSTASQQISIDTGIGFLDHMLHALAKHAGWSLRIHTQGDLHIDDHHTSEDTFLALGSCFRAALGGTTGLARFGHAYAPLDEALARAVVDLSNRPFCVTELGLTREKIGDLSTEMLPHVLHSFAQTAAVSMHVDVLRGVNDHHRAEAAFKALAGALRMATGRVRGREGEVASTKGVL